MKLEDFLLRGVSGVKDTTPIGVRLSGFDDVKDARYDAQPKNVQRRAKICINTNE